VAHELVPGLEGVPADPVRNAGGETAELNGIVGVARPDAVHECRVPPIHSNVYGSRVRDGLHDPISVGIKAAARSSGANALATDNGQADVQPALSWAFSLPHSELTPRDRGASWAFLKVRAYAKAGVRGSNGPIPGPGTTPGDAEHQAANPRLRPVPNEAERKGTRYDPHFELDFASPTGKTYRDSGGDAPQTASVAALIVIINPPAAAGFVVRGCRADERRRGPRLRRGASCARMRERPRLRGHHFGPPSRPDGSFGRAASSSCSSRSAASSMPPCLAKPVAVRLFSRHRGYFGVLMDGIECDPFPRRGAQVRMAVWSAGRSTEGRSRPSDAFRLRAGAPHLQWSRPAMGRGSGRNLYRQWCAGLDNGRGRDLQKGSSAESVGGFSRHGSRVRRRAAGESRENAAKSSPGLYGMQGQAPRANRGLKRRPWAASSKPRNPAEIGAFHSPKAAGRPTNSAEEATKRRSRCHKVRFGPVGS